MSEPINDNHARKKAIDPSQSFIVQAPAGSGKTELLTQRFLRLLSCTEKHPEEIIAITFTRKSAAEMRHRIIQALNQAADKSWASQQATRHGLQTARLDPLTQPLPQGGEASKDPEASFGVLANKAPEAPHKQLTLTLAKKVLERDQLLHWKLQNNPNRLRILTIDALSAYLVKQMPLSAQLSPALNISDNPRPYYQETIAHFLLSLPDNPPWKSAIETLLLHLDNRVYLLENLLIEILGKREQWLPHIAGQTNNTHLLRQHLENALKNIALESIQSAQSLLSDDILSELIPLADFAGRYCTEHDSDNPIAQCHRLTTLSKTLDAFPQWLGIANLLLTQKGEWRKSITKRQGFPAKGENKEETTLFKSLKAQLLDLLNALSEEDTLKSHLYDIMQAPPHHYSQQQWHIIDALMTLLPLLAAQLNLIFSQNNASDFVELNLAALRALGNDENPTDLALHLDYRINHLLIDEFQDTSALQFQLIEKLMAGWDGNDGRTIFLVGDPMQSIYRFRNAEVGLFLRTQQQGIGNIPLQNLTLASNFRSHKAIVDWNNQHFYIIFPKAPNISVGATCYTPALATKASNGSIHWHPTINDDGSQEALQVTQKIQALCQSSPDESIAILVRSRTHLRHITQQLHQHDILFQAVELEPLLECIEIQDLHSLMRALLHQADQIAWLAILRAPYCGLTLADLHVIAQSAQRKTIWPILKDFETLSLSEDGKLRLRHCVPFLYNTMEHLGRAPLSQQLKNLWMQLGGPEILTHKTQLLNTKNYFKLIETLEVQDTPLSLNTIDDHLKKLFAEPNPNANSHIQIMTIHKAKGLEFDHVLLPGLHRKAPYDKSQILKWLERSNLFNGSDLILAPIKAVDQHFEPIYAYLNRVEKLKSDHECERLLYVAATRAKKSLHFFANVIHEDDGIKPPSKGSFLNLLWHTAQEHFDQAITEHTDIETEDSAPSHPLRRFKSDYLLSKLNQKQEHISRSQIPNITLINPTPRHLGTVIHELLEKIAKQQKINEHYWPVRLKQLGVSESDLPSCINTIKAALQNIQEDPRAQWILSKEHQEERCEYPLSYIENEQLKHIIIDRCFIDSEGTRWIIDYKTNTPTKDTLEQYREQLETYAQVFQRRETHPIRLALYFPLTREWMEWHLQGQK